MSGARGDERGSEAAGDAVDEVEDEAGVGDAVGAMVADAGGAEEGDVGAGSRLRLAARRMASIPCRFAFTSISLNKSHRKIIATCIRASLAAAPGRPLTLPARTSLLASAQQSTTLISSLLTPSPFPSASFHFPPLPNPPLPALPPLLAAVPVLRPFPLRPPGRTCMHTGHVPSMFISGGANLSGRGGPEPMGFQRGMGGGMKVRMAVEAREVVRQRWHTRRSEEIEMRFNECQQE